MVLCGLGIGIVVGYAGFLLIKYVILDPEFPLMLRIGLPLSGAGLLVIFLAVLRERVISNSNEKNMYLKEAQP